MIDRRVISGGNFTEVRTEEKKVTTLPVIPEPATAFHLPVVSEQRPLVSIAELQARLRQEAQVPLENIITPSASMSKQPEVNSPKNGWLSGFVKSVVASIKDTREKILVTKQQEAARKKAAEKNDGWFEKMRKNTVVQKVTRTVAAIGIMATAVGIADTPQFAKETAPSQPVTARGSFLPPLEESGYSVIPDPFVPVLAKNNFIVERQHIQEETGQQLIEIFPETKKEIVVEIKEGDTLLGVLEANGYSVDDLGATIVANKDQIAINATPDQREALELVDSGPTTLTQKAWSWAKRAGERIFAGQKITLEKAHR